MHCLLLSSIDSSAPLGWEEFLPYFRIIFSPGDLGEWENGVILCEMVLDEDGFTRILFCELGVLRVFGEEWEEDGDEHWDKTSRPLFSCLPPLVINLLLLLLSFSTWLRDTSPSTGFDQSWEWFNCDEIGLFFFIFGTLSLVDLVISNSLSPLLFPPISRPYPEIIS